MSARTAQRLLGRSSHLDVGTAALHAGISAHAHAHESASQRSIGSFSQRSESDLESTNFKSLHKDAVFHDPSRLQALLRRDAEQKETNRKLERELRSMAETVHSLVAENACLRSGLGEVKQSLQLACERQTTAQQKQADVQEQQAVAQKVAHDVLSGKMAQLEALMLTQHRQLLDSLSRPAAPSTSTPLPQQQQAQQQSQTAPPPPPPPPPSMYQPPTPSRPERVHALEVIRSATTADCAVGCLRLSSPQ